MMRAIRTALIGAGLLAMAYAALLALRGPDFEPVGHLLFLVAVLVVHDGFLLPTAIIVGAFLVRLIPNSRSRGIVYLALFASLVVTLFALPLLLGHGRRADIPSALPRNYPLGWLACLGVIWVVAALALVLTAYRVRRCTPTARPENSALAAGYPDSPPRRTPPSPTGR